MVNFPAILVSPRQKMINSWRNRLYYENYGRQYKYLRLEPSNRANWQTLYLDGYNYFCR